MRDRRNSEASDVGLDENREQVPILDVQDLPQLYTKPTATALLAALGDLSLQPPSWGTTPRSGSRTQSETATPLPTKRNVGAAGVPQYLTKIISNELNWIEDGGEREQIWEAASQRLSERSGRTAMGAMTRTFAIPLTSKTAQASHSGEVTTAASLAKNVDEDVVEFTLHEPALTADNLGLKTWASSYLLAKRLVLLRDTLLTCFPEFDDPILELGAGTGLVGLAASVIFHREVLLTDLPTILPNLEANVDFNSAVLAAHSAGLVRATVLDWSNPTQFHPIAGPNTGCRQGPHIYTLILAADPMYDTEHPELLVNTINWHLAIGSHAKVVVEMPLRQGFEKVRKDFREKMEGLGMGIMDEGEEVGYDDWGGGGDNEDLTEVRCRWTVWGWRRPKPIDRDLH